jgi:two-component system, OmpR family, sensor kinase
MGPLAPFVQHISDAFDRLPIRVRLAVVSAFLTFVILCAFALVVGGLTVRRIRTDFEANFDRQVEQTAQQLSTELNVYINPTTFRIAGIKPPLDELPGLPAHSVIKIYTLSGELIAQTPTHGAPSLGAPREGAVSVGGYRVVSEYTLLRVVGAGGGSLGRIIIQYGRPEASDEATVARVRLFLLLGVFAGTGFALLAGMMIARRAMAPIAELTHAAERIAHTRDPTLKVPQPVADDEVAELARTLEGMLHELDAAHSETEATLARQRRFVADASHELRTPLTSVLANLELLADSLHGDQGEAAQSALRSSRRMRRLVADLLLLARSDVGRVVSREPCDLAQIVVEAAAELGPVSDAHEITLDVQPAPVQAARDELHRVTINLIENALRHTPPGTAIRVSVVVHADRAVLTVADNGPGVPPELAGSLFERFVRGAGDRGGSFGLGLAIVRAVTESHGGSVTLEDAKPGARFIVRLPLASNLNDDGQDHRPAAQALVN